MDIHGGGVDNIFPHETNEIAQGEAFLGHPWCNYWFHVHHLVEKDKGKMSKSSGEFLTVSLLQEKGYDPIAYRFFCLQSHYRKPLEFSFEVLDNTAATFNKLVKRVSELKEDGAVDEQVKKEFEDKFREAVSDDLNTSMAITILYDVKADTNDATKLALVQSFDRVLSLDLVGHAKALLEGADDTSDVDPELLEFINAKIEERAAAKKAKDFAKADAIRDELKDRGVEIKDTREGVKWQLI